MLHACSGRIRLVAFLGHHHVERMRRARCLQPQQIDRWYINSRNRVSTCSQGPSNVSTCPRNWVSCNTRLVPLSLDLARYILPPHVWLVQQMHVSQLYTHCMTILVYILRANNSLFLSSTEHQEPCRVQCFLVS